MSNHWPICNHWTTEFELKSAEKNRSEMAVETADKRHRSLAATS
jgi:hypothetical protein